MKRWLSAAAATLSLIQLSPSPQVLLESPKPDLSASVGPRLNPDVDFVRTTGFPHLDGEKVDFLLDTGDISPGAKVDEADIPVLAYRWNGRAMKQRQIGTHLRNYIATFPFKQQRVYTSRPGKQASELRSEMNDAEWDRHMEYMVFQKIRYRRYVSRSEREWLADHVDSFDAIMRQHIARRRSGKLPLWESLELWLREHSERSSSDLMNRVLEQHRLEVQLEESRS